MKKSNRSPQRRCIGCGKSFDQNELIRVRKDRGENGRSAYLCKNETCLALAIKKKGLERSFRCQVDSELYRILQEELLSK